MPMAPQRLLGDASQTPCCPLASRMPEEYRISPRDELCLTARAKCKHAGRSQIYRLAVALHPSWPRHSLDLYKQCPAKRTPSLSQVAERRVQMTALQNGSHQWLGWPKSRL